MRTPSQAKQAALATKTNHPGWCQYQVRTWLDAPSAGDYDGDGASDAEDGWKKEPASARRFDRTGREGYPASFLGGSNDNGHRALFIAPGVVRSTDFNGLTKQYDPGVVGNGTVAEVERALGVDYVGWSLSMDGNMIPPDPKPKVSRVQKFRRHGNPWRFYYLLRAVRAGRKGRVETVVRHIQHQVDRLPQHEHNTRVSKFIEAFHHDHIIRMGLLNRAVKHGRIGIVKHVRDMIREEIHSLPKR